MKEKEYTIELILPSYFSSITSTLIYIIKILEKIK